MPLFEFAVIYVPSPTKDQMERGEKPKHELLVDVQRVIAKDQAQAQMLAARSIPESHTDRLDQLEIAVRPF